MSRPKELSCGQILELAAGAGGGILGLSTYETIMNAPPSPETTLLQLGAIAGGCAFFFAIGGAAYDTVFDDWNRGDGPNPPSNGDDNN